MKNIIWTLLLVSTLSVAFTSCREEDKRKVEENVESTVDDIEEGIENAADDVKEAYEEVKTDLKEAKEELEK